jgi:hypothetical protein
MTSLGLERLFDGHIRMTGQRKALNALARIRGYADYPVSKSDRCLVIDNVDLACGEGGGGGGMRGGRIDI